MTKRGNALSKKKCLKSGLEKTTPIEPVKERLTPSGSTCIQFPLKLAWAWIVYKVQGNSSPQGLTVEKAVCVS